jgi:pimeloyl-ACP methyl ester carboxylesterase
MQEMFGCAEEALEVCGVRGPVDMVGHSQGGFAALALAVERPPFRAAPRAGGGGWTFVDESTGGDMEPKPPRPPALRLTRLAVLPHAPVGRSEADVQPHLRRLVLQSDAVREAADQTLRLAAWYSSSNALGAGGEAPRLPPPSRGGKRPGAAAGRSPRLADAPPIAPKSWSEDSQTPGLWCSRRVGTTRSSSRRESSGRSWADS